jgi:LysR family transcriptional regulator, hydrogen peroxide-inducible genes activator
MNLRDLQYLVAVADEGHFGKAAQHCHVSQPTLSMQLKKMEEYLGVQLFERTNKQVMITQAGEKIAGRARQVLRDTQEIRDIAKTAQNPYAGDFRLGAFPTLAPYFLPQVVPAIARKLPKLKLLLVEEKTEQLLDKLNTGSLDAALIALPIKDEGLDSTPLLNDPFLLAVPMNHAFTGRKHVNPGDLKKEQLLLLEEGHCLRNQALEVCGMIGASEHQDFRATSLETLRQMVAAGVGITLIPKLAMRKNDGIDYIPFIKPAISRTIGLVWRKTSARKSCIEAMIGLMTAKD